MRRHVRLVGSSLRRARPLETQSALQLRLAKTAHPSNCLHYYPTADNTLKHSGNLPNLLTLLDNAADG